MNHVAEKLQHKVDIHAREHVIEYFRTENARLTETVVRQGDIILELRRHRDALLETVERYRRQIALTQSHEQKRGNDISDPGTSTENIQE